MDKSQLRACTEEELEAALADAIRRGGSGYSDRIKVEKEMRRRRQQSTAVLPQKHAYSNNDLAYLWRHPWAIPWTVGGRSLAFRSGRRLILTVIGIPLLLIGLIILLPTVKAFASHGLGPVTFFLVVVIAAPLTIMGWAFLASPSHIERRNLRYSDFLDLAD
ncbi:MAG: hypothetical protein ACPHCJ_02085 [Oceanococcaceae bacterium]